MTEDRPSAAGSATDTTEGSAPAGAGSAHADPAASPPPASPSALHDPPATPAPAKLPAAGTTTGRGQGSTAQQASSVTNASSAPVQTMSPRQSPTGKPTPASGQPVTSPATGPAAQAQQAQPAQAPPVVAGHSAAVSPATQVGRAVADYAQTLSPAARAPGGAWRIVVRLDPPELGNVDATLNLGPDGLHVDLVASTPEAAQALQASAHQLSSSLAATVTVSHSAPGGSGGFAGSAPGGGGGAGNPGEPGRTPQHSTPDDPGLAVADRAVEAPGRRGEILVRA